MRLAYAFIRAAGIGAVAFLLVLRPDVFSHAEEKSAKDPSIYIPYYLSEGSPYILQSKEADEENESGTETPFGRMRALYLRRRAYDGLLLRYKRNSAAAATDRTEVKTAFFSPNDPYYDLQWGLKHINIEEAWKLSTGKDTLVAVLDTGIDYGHPDIASQLWRNPDEIPGDGIDNDGNGYIDDRMGWDFAGTRWYHWKQDNDVLDRHGHGTHVSGIVAAAGNNSEGIVGVAPDARILPVKVLDDTGRGSWTSVARGIKYAADMGARIINLSLGGWGYASPYSFLGRMVNYAFSKGCVIIAAAGNSRANAARFLPGNMPKVISVSATASRNDNMAYFSNYGRTIDVAAPGINILSLRASGTGYNSRLRGYDFLPRWDPNAEYRWLHGTSMAAPFVSGITALLLSREPGLSPQEVRSRLRSASVDLGNPGFDVYYGYGRIDAYRTVAGTDGTTGGEAKSAAGSAGTASRSALMKASGKNGDHAAWGTDIDELISKQEALMKNRSEFTGSSPKAEIHIPARLSDM